eukprot:1156620-Pelagomonas_calceolata.AAC.14
MQAHAKQPHPLNTLRLWLTDEADASTCRNSAAAEASCKGSPESRPKILGAAGVFPADSGTKERKAAMSSESPAPEVGEGFTGAERSGMSQKVVIILRLPRGKPKEKGLWVQTLLVLIIAANTERTCQGGQKH